MAMMTTTKQFIDSKTPEDQSEVPPPSYNEVYRTSASRDLVQHSYVPALVQASSSSSSTFKPVVIPQTSKSLRGAFFSPFSRAYSPTIAQAGISQQEFLAFLDGLNEAFISHPAFQITSYVGTGLSMVHLPIVPLVGMGISTAAGFASAGTSWTRAKSYVKTANEELFGPKGLKIRILKTPKMMSAVGAGTASGQLNLPPLDIPKGPQMDEANDPRMRRIRALGDRVAPLTFSGLPEPEELDSWWKRCGSKEAIKKDEEMQRKLMKERAKGYVKSEKRVLEAELEARKYDDEIIDLETEKRREFAKAERKLAKKGVDPEERVKIEDNLSKELRKLDRDIEKNLKEKEWKVGRADIREEKVDDKEHEIAQKIHWIVILRAEQDCNGLEAEVDVESLHSKGA